MKGTPSGPWSYGPLLWLMTAILGTQTMAHEEHWCDDTPQTNKDYKEDKCSNFVDNFILGYNLDRESSNMVGMTDDEIQQDLNLWTQFPDISPICSFVKVSVITVTTCCAGWQGDNCTIPVCSPECANGGSCIDPDTCACTPSFAGVHCGESKELASGGMRYCYEYNSCLGYTLANLEGIVSEELCCSSGGAGWGIHGGDCVECPQGQQTIDDPDYEPGEPTVVTQTTALPFRTCASYGPNYYRTFDGLEYMYPGRCTYTLYSDLNSRISVTHIDCHSFLKCTKILSMKLNSEELIVAHGANITVNGQDFVLTPEGFAYPNSASHLEQRGDSFYLEYGKLRVRWDEGGSWMISRDLKLNEPGSHDIRGMCGNFDGDPLNDMVRRDLYPESNVPAFGNSWAEVHEDDICPDAPAYGHPCHTTDMEVKAETACAYLRSPAFAGCHKIIGVSHYYARCLNDYCSALNYVESHPEFSDLKVSEELEAVRCVSFAYYSEQCTAQHINLSWRTANICPRDCAENMEYSECTLKCQRTCATLDKVLPPECEKECYPGCQCVPGTVYYYNMCIQPEQCPCTYQRVGYAQGDSVQVDCNTCECTMGRWVCTDNVCADTCSVIGNQHITTFDDYPFDYQGYDCIYKLVQLKSSELLTESTLSKGELEIQYEVRECTAAGVMCTKSVTTIIRKKKKVPTATLR